MAVRYQVGVARCAGYEWDETLPAVRSAIRNAVGLPSAVAGEVLIKPNLLSPSSPEQAVTTHPRIIQALIAELLESCTSSAPVSIHVSDSPGYVYTDGAALLAKTGMAEVVEMCPATAGTLSDRGYRTVCNADGAVLREPRLSNRYLDTAYCVNVAKLKTHVETEISCCLKNLFGAADTATRKSAHRSRSQKHLANAIIDIFCAKPPTFNIVDAIVGMEGDGPSHGRPRHAGWVIAAENALAADWTAAIMMGYRDPLAIPLIREAARRGLGPKSAGAIKLIGADWADLPVRGFVRSSGALRLVPTFLRGLAHGIVKLRPKLETTRCVNCGICREVCPVEAIRGGRDYPEINMLVCVGCLCCHEMCPAGAVAVERNLAARIVGRLSGD